MWAVALVATAFFLYLCVTMMRKILPFLFLVTRLAAQIDSTQHIDTVSVRLIPSFHQLTVPKMLFARYEQLSIDSTDLRHSATQSLADLLASKSHFFVKSYGAGGLATLSGRGGSATQTALYWEGTTIQNPMLGQADLSLIPAFMIDHVSVFSNVPANYFISNNAIAGAVSINQNNTYGQGWRCLFATAGGSFGYFTQQARLSYGAAKYSVSLRGFYQTAQNDFPFKHPNLIGKPLVRQPNAALEQGGVLGEVYWKAGKHHDFSAKTWLQQSYREIPPSLLQTNANDQQQDRSLRQVLRWTYQRKSFAALLRAVAVVEQLHYRNSAVLSNSLTQSYALQCSAYKVIKHRHFLISQAQYQYSRAQSSGYDTLPQRHNAFLRLGYHLLFERWTLMASAQGEVVDKRFTAPSALLRANLRLVRWWETHLRASQNYRLPSFNDLYWAGVGNPNLRPEYAWELEWTNLFSPYTKDEIFYFRGEVTLFSRWVRDWILWAPDPQTGLWRPDNVQRVWARGVELKAEGLLFFKNNLQLTVHGRYALQAVTNQDGETLIYVPNHNAALGIELKYKGLQISYLHSLVSRRYLTNDNSDWLPPYHFGTLDLRYDFSLENKLPDSKNRYFVLSLFVRCQNLSNQTYQVVSQRMMPGQQWTAGAQMSF